MKLRTLKIPGVSKFARNEGGGTLAELAILLPILAVMLAAVSEFGRYFQTYTTLAKGTRSAARYLSNHPNSTDEQNKAKNLVVCGTLAACADGDRLVRGLEVTNVCIQTTGSPKIETVTVRIPKTAEGECGAPLNYQPIFNIGALLHNTIDLNLPLTPSTTMRYMLD